MLLFNKNSGIIIALYPRFLLHAICNIAVIITFCRVRNLKIILKEFKLFHWHWFCLFRVFIHVCTSLIIILTIWYNYMYMLLYGTPHQCSNFVTLPPFLVCSTELLLWRPCIHFQYKSIVKSRSYVWKFYKQ